MDGHDGTGASRARKRAPTLPAEEAAAAWERWYVLWGEHDVVGNDPGTCVFAGSEADASAVAEDLNYWASRRGESQGWNVVTPELAETPAGFWSDIEVAAACLAVSANRANSGAARRFFVERAEAMEKGGAVAYPILKRKQQGGGAVFDVKVSDDGQALDFSLDAVWRRTRKGSTAQRVIDVLARAVRGAGDGGWANYADSSLRHLAPTEAVFWEVMRTSKGPDRRCPMAERVFEVEHGRARFRPEFHAKIAERIGSVSA